MVGVFPWPHGAYPFRSGDGLNHWLSNDVPITSTLSVKHMMPAQGFDPSRGGRLPALGTVAACADRAAPHPSAVCSRGCGPGASSALRVPIVFGTARPIPRKVDASGYTRPRPDAGGDRMEQ
jgi:hypothetical protein